MSNGRVHSSSNIKRLYKRSPRLTLAQRKSVLFLIQRHTQTGQLVPLPMSWLPRWRTQGVNLLPYRYSLSTLVLTKSLYEYIVCRTLCFFPIPTFDLSPDWFVVNCPYTVVKCLWPSDVYSSSLKEIFLVLFHIVFTPYYHIINVTYFNSFLFIIRFTVLFGGGTVLIIIDLIPPKIREGPRQNCRGSIVLTLVWKETTLGRDESGIHLRNPVLDLGERMSYDPES